MGWCSRNRVEPQDKLSQAGGTWGRIFVVGMLSLSINVGVLLVSERDWLIPVLDCERKHMKALSKRPAVNCLRAAVNPTGREGRNLSHLTNESPMLCSDR